MHHARNYYAIVTPPQLAGSAGPMAEGHRRSDDKEPLVEETSFGGEETHDEHGHEREGSEEPPTPVNNQPLPPLK